MTCVDDAIHDLNLLLLITSIISRFVINWRLRDNVKPKTLHKIKLDNPLSSVKFHYLANRRMQIKNILYCIKRSITGNRAAGNVAAKESRKRGRELY